MKPLVLCADDFAWNAAVSDGIAALAEHDRLSATSAMVLSPRWPHDVLRLRDLQGRLDVGLHLDWTSPFAVSAGHGHSLAGTMARAVLGRLGLTPAREVIERQLDAFESHWKAPPDHVDGHQHVQQFAGIRDALVEVLARRYPRHAPWVRVSQPAAGRQDVKSRVISAMGAGDLRQLADRAAIPSSPALAGIYDFQGGPKAYGRRMDRWLATSPPGTVVMCHPAAVVDACDGIGLARAGEFAYLRGEAFEIALHSAGVKLLRGTALYTARQ